jgi:hypothetical protein
LKNDELKKHIRKRFLRRKIKSYLYEDWLTEKDVKKYAVKKRRK